MTEKVKMPDGDQDHDQVILVQLSTSSPMLFHPWIRRSTTIISAWWL